MMYLSVLVSTTIVSLLFIISPSSYIEAVESSSYRRSRGSTSSSQRRLGVGYNTNGRVIPNGRSGKAGKGGKAGKHHGYYNNENQYPENSYGESRDETETEDPTTFEPTTSPVTSPIPVPTTNPDEPTNQRVPIPGERPVPSDDAESSPASSPSSSNNVGGPVQIMITQSPSSSSIQINLEPTTGRGDNIPTLDGSNNGIGGVGIEVVTIDNESGNGSTTSTTNGEESSVQDESDENGNPSGGVTGIVVVEVNEDGPIVDVSVVTEGGNNGEGGSSSSSSTGSGTGAGTGDLPSLGTDGEGNEAGGSSTENVIGTENDNDVSNEDNSNLVNDPSISIGNVNGGDGDGNEGDSTSGIDASEGIGGEGNDVGSSTGIEGENDASIEDNGTVGNESGNDTNEGEVGSDANGGASIESGTGNDSGEDGSGTGNDSGEDGSGTGNASGEDGSGTGNASGEDGLTNENGSDTDEENQAAPSDETTGTTGAVDLVNGTSGENNGGNPTDGTGSDADEVDPTGGSGSETDGSESETDEVDPTGGSSSGNENGESDGNGVGVGGDDSDNSVVGNNEGTGNGNNGGGEEEEEEGLTGSNTDGEVTVNIDGNVDNTAEFCPDKSPDKSVNINWIYAVEFSPGLTEKQKTETMAIMELKLVSEVLNCNKIPTRKYFRHRHLFEDDIAGLDYMPIDTKNEEVVCFSNSTTAGGGFCETYFGRMVMYLVRDAKGQVAINDMLYAIRNTMQRSDFPSMDTIIQVWYLEPELIDASGISDGSVVITDKQQGIDGSFSTGAVTAFAALGVFVLAALVLGIFRMRRSQPDGVSTLGPGGSHMTGSHMTSTQPNDGFHLKETPFSAMLPNSYRLDEPEAMSCIMEGDSDSDRCQHSVIISDGGYTSDGESQNAMMEEIYPPQLEPVLGAQKIDEENMETDRDLLFDNDDISSMGRSNFTFDAANRNDDTERDQSNHRKQNLVTGADVSLGEKQSSVDVHQCNSANCKLCNYKPKDVEFIGGESYEQEF